MPVARCSRNRPVRCRVTVPRSVLSTTGEWTARSWFQLEKHGYRVRRSDGTRRGRSTSVPSTPAILQNIDLGRVQRLMAQIEGQVPEKTHGVFAHILARSTGPCPVSEVAEGLGSTVQTLQGIALHFTSRLQRVSSPWDGSSPSTGSPSGAANPRVPLRVPSGSRIARTTVGWYAAPYWHRLRLPGSGAAPTMWRESFVRALAPPVHTPPTPMRFAGGQRHLKLP